MPRQEISSVFSDGLMMDLNPINTPKSVLTDCLNGTYITYNGNEFVLQNDMGNYKLKNCKLPTNFIPVGVKGYADILYIVSYNPFTKEVEIGSYPAPQSIFTTSDTENAIAETEELTSFSWNGERTYTDLITKEKKALFVFAGENEETSKLNPGDEFKLAGLSTEKPAYYYQHLNFYVIDEDNKLYDLNDEDIYYYKGEKWDGADFRKVFWETPGWLAAQYDLYVPDKFNLNLRSLNVPEFLIINSDDGIDTQTEETPIDELEPGSTQFKVSMDLSSQTIISDLLFQAELNEHYNNNQGPFEDLYIRYLVKTADSDKIAETDKSDYGTFVGIKYDNGEVKKEEGFTEINENGSYIYFDIPVWKHNYQDDIITAYNNIHPIWFCNNPKLNQQTEEFNITDYKGVVELTAYPIIKVKTDNGESVLKFTQFSTTQRFPLNTLKNSNNITIADSIYKWSVDDDSCTISFNVNGPFINASDITGRYEIYRINLFDNSEWPELNTKSDLNNPKSYSKWTGLNKTEKTDKKGILKFNETLNKWEFHETNIDNSHFVNQEKVLMCEGKLSNLVLYGQNTLNINWDLSNEYELTEYQNRYTNPDFDSLISPNLTTNKGFLEDTSYVGYENKTKTIDFNKEGGIYIFRVILEQGTQELAVKDSVLIPSEVFNEWFGSIDNYLDETNGITSSMWVGKWLDNLNYSISTFNNINISLTLDLDDQDYDFITYKWGNNIEKTLEIVLGSDGIIDWSNTFLNIIKEQFGENYSELDSIKLENLTFYLDINKLLNKEQSNVNIVINDSSKLKGNLWNPQDNIIFTLKQNGQTTPIKIKSINNQNLILLDKIQEIVVNVSPNTTSSVKLLSSNYPFYEMFGTSYMIPNLTTVDFENTELTGGQYLNSGQGSDYGRNIRWVVKFGKRPDSGSGDANPVIVEMADGTNSKGAEWGVNENTFGFVGEILTTWNLSWARGRLFTTSNGNTWENTIVIDDESADAWNLGVLIDGVNQTGVEGLFFKAARGNSNKSKSVFVQFGSNLETKRMFCYGLMQLKIENYSTNPTTIHIPTLSYSELNNKETIGFNKSDILINLDLLKVDDRFLLYKNIIQNLKDISSTIILNTDININTSKTIYNVSIPNTIVEINLSENIKWVTFNSQLNYFVNNVFNTSQQSIISTISQRTGGSKLIYDTEEPNNVFPDWYKAFMNNDFGRYTKPDTTIYRDTLLKKFESYTPGAVITKSNIAFVNDSLKTVKLVNSPRDRDSSKAKDWSPRIIVCYYESLS